MSVKTDEHTRGGQDDTEYVVDFSFYDNDFEETNTFGNIEMQNTHNTNCQQNTQGDTSNEFRGVFNADNANLPPKKSKENILDIPVGLKASTNTPGSGDALCTKDRLENMQTLPFDMFSRDPMSLNEEIEEKKVICSVPKYPASTVITHANMLLDVEECSNTDAMEVAGVQPVELETLDDDDVVNEEDRTDCTNDDLESHISSNYQESVETQRANIQQIAEALKDLSRSSKYHNIRPPWRDPNSRPLPSDETMCVEKMLREYNQMTVSERKQMAIANTNAQQLNVVRRPYHSTLNRWRQQERIQFENFFIAQRLRNVRPSRDISREELLRQHKEYFITSFNTSASADFEVDDLLALSNGTLRQHTFPRPPTSISSAKTPIKRDSTSYITNFSTSTKGTARTSNHCSRPKTAMTGRIRAKSECSNWSGKKYHEYPYATNYKINNKSQIGLFKNPPSTRESVNKGDEFHFRRRPSTAIQK